MTKIIDIVNNLIKKAKDNKKIKNVVFVKAFRESFAENPINRFVAVVKIENINLSDFAGGYAKNNIKGELYTVKVVIDVYSGSDISGETLSDMTLKIYDAIKSADESGMISDSYVSPISFDKDTNAIYRKINIDLDFCLCGEK